MTKTGYLKALRSMSTEKILDELWDMENSLRKYRAYGSATGKRAIPPHSMFIRNIRKNVARAKTILRERGVKV